VILSFGLLLPRPARNPSTDAICCCVVFGVLTGRFFSGHEAFLAYVTSIEAFLAPSTC